MSGDGRLRQTPCSGWMCHGCGESYAACPDGPCVKCNGRAFERVGPDQPLRRAAAETDRVERIKRIYERIKMKTEPEKLDVEVYEPPQKTKKPAAWAKVGKGRIIFSPAASAEHLAGMEVAVIGVSRSAPRRICIMPYQTAKNAGARAVPVGKPSPKGQQAIRCGAEFCDRFKAWQKLRLSITRNGEWLTLMPV